MSVWSLLHEADPWRRKIQLEGVEYITSKLYRSYRWGGVRAFMFQQKGAHRALVNFCVVMTTVI